MGETVLNPGIGSLNNVVGRRSLKPKLHDTSYLQLKHKKAAWLAALSGLRY